MPEIPGLLPPNVQDGEGRRYSNFQASVGGMVDSYYEVCFQKPAIDGMDKRRRRFVHSLTSTHSFIFCIYSIFSRNGSCWMERQPNTRKCVSSHVVCLVSMWFKLHTCLYTSLLF